MKSRVGMPVRVFAIGALVLAPVIFGGAILVGKRPLKRSASVAMSPAKPRSTFSDLDLKLLARDAHDALYAVESAKFMLRLETTPAAIELARYNLDEATATLRKATADFEKAKDEWGSSDPLVERVDRWKRDADQAARIYYLSRGEAKESAHANYRAAARGVFDL